MKLHEYPVIVIVWGQDGCGMCEEYVPRFRQIAEEYVGCVPSAVLDCGELDESWLRHYNIVHVPCTMVMRRGKITARRNVSLDDKGIRHFFGLATFGRECDLG